MGVAHGLNWCGGTFPEHSTRSQSLSVVYGHTWLQVLRLSLGYNPTGGNFAADFGIGKSRTLQWELVFVLFAVGVILGSFWVSLAGVRCHQENNVRRQRKWGVDRKVKTGFVLGL